jgi:nucleoporin NUP82
MIIVGVCILTHHIREYDVSADPEEPTQTHSFIPERRTRSYAAEDPSGREAVSFTFGQGDGDWSLLTVYAAMRNGDIYAICPFMPVNASVSSYWKSG